MKKKILLVWYQRGDNFGDVLLYQTTKAYLESAGYDVASHEVGDSGQKIAEHANQCDFMIFAGGGIIERYVPRVIQNIGELVKVLEVPYGVIGLGIGTFDYHAYADAFRCWVEQALFFYVRDMATRDYLNLLTGNQKVVFSGDVVFANRAIERYAKIGCKIGLNLRDIPYADIQGEFDWNQLNRIFHEINCSIIIPDSNSQIAHLRQTFDNLGEIENYRNFSQNLKIEKTISAIQKCNVVIAMRFHIVLVSALLGIIPIPILYCPKVRYLAEQLGITDLAIELGEWDQLPKKVDMAYKEMNRYTSILSEKTAMMRKNVQTMYRTIINTLKEMEGSIEK